ncbi:MAG: polymer-forming cytoskeletal protein [Alphaproteobacteria bacterium]
MFRRKDEGGDMLTDEIAEEFMMEPAETQQSLRSLNAAEVRAPMAETPAAARPSAPAQPAFRPAPPQAAMAAMRPAPAPMQSAAPAAAPAAASAAASKLSSSAKRVLTVGPDIQMKGEITTCDRVVIEGVVDATMKDVHTLELAQSGLLKGVAEVEDAEISGAFDGDLIVRGRLVVYATGRIRGNITYGEVEIERGGQLSGSVRNISEAAGKGAQISKRIA